MHIKDLKDGKGLPQAAFINSTCWHTGEVKTLLAFTIIDMLCVHSDRSGQETASDETLHSNVSALFLRPTACACPRCSSTVRRHCSGFGGCIICRKLEK